MFTTAAPLSQRIERLIDETSIVDPHTHIQASRPSAPDLAALMSYHWLQTELHSVGMPKDAFANDLSVEERVARALPYLFRMRHTAMSWCFKKILRDLFDMRGITLDKHNYVDVMDRVAASGASDTWAADVLGRRCRIQALVTSAGNAAQENAPSRAGVDVFHMLDAHYLFCPGVATDLTPYFTGRTERAGYLDALAAILGDAPPTAAALRRGLWDWLERVVTDRVRFSNTFIPIEQRFSEPDESEVDAVLGRNARGTALVDSEVDILVRFVTWQVLGWHHERRKAFQIAVGAEYFICDGKSIPRFDPTWTSQMAPVFHTFSGARFDLMMASEAMMQDMCVLARQFPNVYLSGYWWHSFFPTLIEKALMLRLQIAPTTKLTAFLCDAYYCEWIYGKLQMVKSAASRALANLVEARLLDEDDLPALLRQILHDTPRDLYDLGH